MAENGIKLYNFDKVKHGEAGGSEADDQPPFAVVAANTLTSLEDGRVVEEPIRDEYFHNSSNALGK